MNHVKLSIENFKFLLDRQRELENFKRSKTFYIKQHYSGLGSEEVVYTDDEAVIELVKEIKSLKERLKNVRVPIVETLQSTKPWWKIF